MPGGDLTLAAIPAERGPQRNFRKSLAGWKGARPSPGILGAISALRVLRKVCRGAFALVGDASGSVDSLTGEGLGLAFQQANALAEALAER